MDNEATLSGIIASEPVFSHSIHETRLYICTLCVKRLSGTIDRIVLLASEALCPNLTGEVTVHGQLRGYTRQDADKRRLILMVLVRKVMPGLAEENNVIALHGTLVREASYRKTPLGREIADLMLRVPRPYAGTDYIPCVVWGRCARFCTHLQKGVKLQVIGRMQSREYTKLIDGVADKRTAYELSIGRLTVLTGKEK